jgi:predicted DNA-binding WGR domain protein
MRRFEYRDQKSSKFWAIELQGCSFRVTFGKIGKAGQTLLKEFADETSARSEHDKLVAEKTRKGYVEVSTATAPANPFVLAMAQAREEKLARRTSAKPPPLLDRLQALLDEPLDDDALLQRLEAFRTELAFAGLIRVWGPALYRRNAERFRPFLQPYLMWLQGKWGKEFEGWLAEAERADDAEVFRRLYAAKLQKTVGDQHGALEKRWRGDLLAAFRSAASPAARARVLARHDLAWTLDESTALELYNLDAAARDFILGHLDYSQYGSRDRYANLRSRAQKAGDDDFFFVLYCRTVTTKQWQQDIVALADQVVDADRLVAELERRHPAWGNTAAGIEALLRRRGKDVLPYVLNHLDTLTGAWHIQPPRSLLDLALSRGWTDLWGGLVRRLADPKAFEVGLTPTRPTPEEEPGNDKAPDNGTDESGRSARVNRRSIKFSSSS